MAALGGGPSSRGVGSAGRRGGTTARQAGDSSTAGSNHEPGGPDLQTLHSLLRVVGDQLTSRDIKSLKLLYSSTLSEQLMRPVTDGPSFFLALERIGRVDESNMKHVLHLLRLIKRYDLMRCLVLRKRKTVLSDAVVDYLERSTCFLTPTKRRKLDASPPSDEPVQAGSTPSDPLLSDGDDLSKLGTMSDQGRQGLAGERSAVKVRPAVLRVPVTAVRSESRVQSVAAECAVAATGAGPDMEEKRTCDIRLRVRAEYCEHATALDGNVHSSKHELIERQFEKFMQANTILKSRDLGSIVCDIKFSELTYLDAFWRDYINGSLQEALRTVFITESLKQAVGQEPIKLLVNVDEDDYEAGRLILLSNLIG